MDVLDTCFIIGQVRIILPCLLALTYGAANVIRENEDFADDLMEDNKGPTSIMLKFLQPRDVDANDLLDDQIAVINAFLGRNAVANTIRQLLESFRDTVVNGSDDLPILDPLVIDHLGPFVYTHTGVRMTGNVRNFRMEGLRFYVVNDVTFNALRLAVGARLTVPWLIFTGSYDAAASIALITHRSGGNYRIFLNRLDVGVDARLGTNILGGHLVLRSLDIKIDVSDVQINISGLTGSSVLNNVINGIVQSVTREFVNTQMEDVSKLISKELFEVINEVLKNFTLDDLLR